MQQEKWKQWAGKVSPTGWQWLMLTILSTLLMSGFIVMTVSLLTTAHAADSYDVDGENGVLQVHGALSESACRLEMASAWQDIDMGNLATGRLRHVGDRGTPVMVRLKLQDCVEGPVRTLDERSGNLRWSPGQPAVSVRFIATADDDNPQLVQVQGAEGLALRITDKLGRDVHLGSKGDSLLLTPGDNQLTYTVTPERTRAPLYAGEFRAKINFGLSYD